MILLTAVEQSGGGIPVLFFVVPIAIIFLLILGSIKMPPMTAWGLRKAFAKLGNLKGKELSEIKAVAGQPNSYHVMPDNQRLVQWIKPGYTIALIFDENDICLGITSEISV